MKDYEFVILGGNLGLFTGMSVLSLFELIFWAARFIFGGGNVKEEPGNKDTERQPRKTIQKRKGLRKVSKYSR